jgi:hypothetical protein
MEGRKKRNQRSGSRDLAPTSHNGDEHEVKKRKRSQEQETQISRYETNGNGKHRERTRSGKGNRKKNDPPENRDHSGDGSIDDTIGHYHGANGTIILNRCNPYSSHLPLITQ